MNILVVDDEYYIVQGIIKNINWENIGIDQVFSAYSMKQAQDIFMQHDIDILLTDIEMPKGSGLDLIAWANDNSYHPVKLILTGHQNFTYAQKAILLQCFQYVLKPVENSVLEDELSRAVAKVNENKNLDRAKNIAITWDANHTLRFETFWRDLYTSTSIPLEENILASLQRMSMPTDWLKLDFYYLLFKVHSKNIFATTSEKIPLGEIHTIISNMVSDPVDSSFYKFTASEFIFALPANAINHYQNALHFSETMLNELIAALPGYRFSIYLSDKASISTAADTYQLLKSFEESIFTTESIVIPVHSLTNSSPSELSDSQLINMPLSDWSEYLLQFKTDLILEDIKALFKRNTNYYPVKMLIALYYGVLQTVFSVLDSKDISMNEIFPKLIHHTDLNRATSSIENFLFWAEHLLIDTEEVLRVNADSASFVDAVKKYVKTHLSSEDLNRNSIAEAIHMNPDYVSYLFHKQSGQLLNSYITNERINAAKKLLITTDLSLQAIADSTGFTNSSYFHKQFKKFTGVTPQQYRSNE